MIFRLTVYLGIPQRKVRLSPKSSIHVPFLARSDASHAVQSIQYRLQTRQNRTIQFDRERAFQTRFMLRLLEQVLQFDKLDLQVQFPFMFALVRDSHSKALHTLP